MLIDTHCHLNFEAYDADRDAVLARSAEARVTRVINPGIDRASSEAAVALAASYEGVYAAVGVHPNSTAGWDDNELAWIEGLALANEKVVAVGEIGLDYYWDKSLPEVQAGAFRAQLGLAARLELPVIIHNREASADVLPVLEAWVTTLPGKLRDRPGVLHSFSAPQAYADRALEAGFYLGFTGPLTFKNAPELRQVAATVPLDRLLVETDGPFLTPHPHRGKRNEPSYIPLIVDRLATVHGVPVDEMRRITTANAQRLFGLG
jgi:TatD DNase family protein